MRNLSEYLVHLLRRGTTLDRSYLSVLRDHCLVCEEVISEAPLYLKYRLCPYCRFHYSLTARERIELLVNKGSFRETNRSIASLYPLSFSSRGSYTNRLSQAQTRTGLTEAAITGGCTIADSHVMIVVLDFGFMGGSMGSVVGEKVALAFESAAKREYPLVALVSGGGARIQEGVLSLMQMAKTVAAANRLKEKKCSFHSGAFKSGNRTGVCQLCQSGGPYLRRTRLSHWPCPDENPQGGVEEAPAIGRPHRRGTPGTWTCWIVWLTVRN